MNGWLALILGAFLMGYGFVGIASGYELTKSEWEQYRLSELCYVMEGDITIELLDEYCNMSYGGKHYGDKIQ